MASIVYTVILIVSFLFLVWKNDDKESYFPLKIIGYFILGSFAFNFNQISLPLGFVVYLIFFRPKLNVQVKRIVKWSLVFLHLYSSKGPYHMQWMNGKVAQYSLSMNLVQYIR